MKTKKFRRALIFAIIFWLFLSFVFMNGDWHGFGVDSEGLVYIGTENYIRKAAVINVYQDGEYLKSIPVPPNRSYCFTVQSDDTILVSISDDVYVLDLTGAELSHWKDPQFSVHDELARKKEVVNKNGDHFLYRNILGYRSIVAEDGKVLWSMPLDDYLAHIASSLFFLVFSLVVFIGSEDKRQKQKKVL